MARKKIISQDIRDQVIAIVNQFNAENVKETQDNPIQQLMQMLRLSSSRNKENKPPVDAYVPRFRGAYLYLDRMGYHGRLVEICRLKWTGSMDAWDFAIYRHSKNFYDPDEWFFPGAGEVDGTVSGAMRAGNHAYPV